MAFAAASRSSQFRFSAKEPEPQNAGSREKWVMWLNFKVGKETLHCSLHLWPLILVWRTRENSISSVPKIISKLRFACGFDSFGPLETLCISESHFRAFEPSLGWPNHGANTQHHPTFTPRRNPRLLQKNGRQFPLPTPRTLPSPWSGFCAYKSFTMAPIGDDAVKSLQDLVNKLESRVKELEDRIQHASGGTKHTAVEGIRMILMGPPGAGA